MSIGTLPPAALGAPFPKPEDSKELGTGGVHGANNTPSSRAPLEIHPPPAPPAPHLTADQNELPAPENLPPERPPLEKVEKDLMTKLAEFQAELMKSNQETSRNFKERAYQDQSNILATAEVVYDLDIKAAEADKKSTLANAYSEMAAGAVQIGFSGAGLGAVGRSASLSSQAASASPQLAGRLAGKAQNMNSIGMPLSQMGGGIASITTGVGKTLGAEDAYDAAEHRADSKREQVAQEIHNSNYQLFLSSADQARDAMRGAMDSYSTITQGTQGALSSMARNFG
jgi:hypothetical protein